MILLYFNESIIIVKDDYFGDFALIINDLHRFRRGVVPLCGQRIPVV